MKVVILLSRLEELIDELCPNGVEYVELGNILDYKQPSKYIVNSTEYKDDFKVKKYLKQL